MIFGCKIQWLLTLFFYKIYKILIGINLFLEWEVFFYNIYLYKNFLNFKLVILNLVFSII